jgi:hypothetical protein
MCSWEIAGHFAGTYSLNLQGREVRQARNQQVTDGKGRAIGQVVSHWLPTSAARVRSQVRSCGICGGQSGTGAGFLRVLRFPLPIFIPPTAP